MTQSPSPIPAWFRFGLPFVIVAASMSVVPVADAQTPAGDKKGRVKHLERPQQKGDQGDMAPARREEGNPSFVLRKAIGPDVLRGIMVHKGQPATNRGMIQTGLTAKFDERVHCRSVDDYWAKDYSEVFGGESLHGGIDIPVPFGTPVRAVAAGEVVLKARHENSPDGIQIWLRHSPDDTGLPMWTFTEYAHLQELPDLPLGQRVQMGDVVGLTSNTGISSGEVRQRAGVTVAASSRARRPAIHFAVIYNETGKYFRNEEYIVPLDGWWMDPHAIFRQAPPFDSVSMKALAAEQKNVPIPYMLEDGTKVPADTKLIWPYPCSPSPLPPARRNG